MTLRTNAKIAGVTFLVYIAAGIASMALFARATRGGYECADHVAGVRAAAHVSLRKRA